MKTLLILPLLVLFCIPAHTQYDNMPEVLDQAFYEKYPDAESAYWYLDDDYYRIEFELALDSYSALFTQQGKWYETAKVISDSEVPAKVLSAVSVKCPDCELSYCEWVEKENNESFYRMNSYTDNAYFVMDINREGALISSQKQAINY